MHLIRASQGADLRMWMLANSTSLSGSVVKQRRPKMVLRNRSLYRIQTAKTGLSSFKVE